VRRANGKGEDASGGRGVATPRTPRATLFFLPYQQRWILDEAPMKLAEKSRRVGFTYATSYRAVQKCLRRPRGFTQWVSSRDLLTAKEFVTDYVAKWARADRPAGVLEEGGLWGHEVARKMIHVLAAAFVPLAAVSARLVYAVLGAATVLYLVSESFRLNGAALPIFTRITRLTARERERRALALGPAAIDTELERVRPVIESGGYIADLDHLVPNDVSCQNYCYYARRLKEMVGAD